MIFNVLSLRESVSATYFRLQNSSRRTYQQPSKTYKRLKTDEFPQEKFLVINIDAPKEPKVSLFD